MTDECTIVTAYYEFPKKKHTSNSYLEWITNFLPIVDSFMIIFTDEQSYEKLYKLRSRYLEKTAIIIKPLEQLYCYKFIDYWDKDFERDHERIHHQNLYIIWNEKSMFMLHALKINPFNTDYYAWTDIGMVRDIDYISYISKYPNKDIIKTLKKDKIYLLNLNDFTEKELTYNTPNELYRYEHNVRIGGGIILGHKDIIPVWTNEYYKMMFEFMQHNYFAGKDQSIMSNVYLKYKDKFIELIKPINSPINIWFYLLYYFGNKNI